MASDKNGRGKREEYLLFLELKLIPAHNQAPPHKRTQIMEVGLHTFLTSALNGGQFHAPVANTRR